MLRPNFRIWRIAYPRYSSSLSSDISENLVPVGRLFLLDNANARSQSITEELDENNEAGSKKKRRSVMRPLPPVRFEYDESWLEEGFALSHDLPLRSGPLFPKLGKRSFSFFDTIKLDSELRFLVEEAESRGAVFDWLLHTPPDEALFTSMLSPSHSLGGLHVTPEGLPHPLSDALLAKTMKMRADVPVFQTSGDELLYAHHAYERNRARAEELALLLSAKTLPGKNAPYTMLYKKEPVAVSFASSNDPVSAPLWKGFSLEVARSVGIRTVQSTLKHLMGEAVLLRSRADRDEQGRPLCALSARALIASKGRSVQTAITYADIVHFLTSQGAAPKTDLPEVWRRMAFTLLTGATGDTPDRWLFVRPVGIRSDGWRLAPAHSLTFTSPSIVMRGGMRLRPGGTRFTTDQAVTYAPYFDLTIQEAKRFVLTVRRKLLDWEVAARDYGISSREIETMADAFED